MLKLHIFFLRFLAISRYQNIAAGNISLETLYSRSKGVYRLHEKSDLIFRVI